MPVNTNYNAGQPSNRYLNYVLVMLTLAYVFNFADRQLVSILQESIKEEFNLSDTQLGFLSGFSFALMYVALGIPIARYADKENRRNIVAASIGLWSILTAISGFAGNFIQLVMARMGVGLGEAGGSPPAHAMISDYFPPEKRARSLSFYSTGIYIGVLIGFLLGGYLNQRYGWRTAFFVVGTPGILFSLLFYFTVKEPKKGATDQRTTTTGKTYSLGSTLKILYANKLFVFLTMAIALHVFCIYALLNWAPSFMSRLHGMKTVDIGISLGLIFGLGGGIGTYARRFLTDLLGKKDRRYYLRVPAYSILLSLLFTAGFIFFRNNYLSLFCLCGCAFLQSIFLGPTIAVAHSLVAAPMRALSSAILFFALNLVGLGFGPLVVGILSDLLKPTQGIESLRWALSIILPLSVASATLFLMAAKKIGMDTRL